MTVKYPQPEDYDSYEEYEYAVNEYDRLELNYIDSYLENYRLNEHHINQQ